VVTTALLSRAMTLSMGPLRRDEIVSAPTPATRTLATGVLATSAEDRERPNGRASTAQAVAVGRTAIWSLRPGRHSPVGASPLAVTPGMETLGTPVVGRSPRRAWACAEVRPYNPA